MTGQFDEGVKDIMRSIGLAAIIGSAAIYGTKAINKELEKSMSSPQEKIQALQQAATQTSDPTAKQAINQAAILVRPNKSLPLQDVRSSDEDIIKQSKPYIMQHEIISQIRIMICFYAKSVNWGFQ